MTKRPPRVLLIDDDEPLASVIRTTLVLEGYTVELVPTREAALGTLPAHPPDLVVMDYLMAGLDAAAFLTQARRGGYRGKVLLCTAWDRETNLGIDGVVHKPFDIDQLAGAVKALVRPGQR
jgi:DNA-binding response OmpR family regulator